MKQSECLVRHWRGTSVLRRVSSLPSRSEQVEETRRTALLADVSAALQPYIDGSGLAFPSESQIIIARK